MGFNSGFKGLILFLSDYLKVQCKLLVSSFT